MIVIADDITGAAEIAGIAFSRGGEVRLVCGAVGCDHIAAQGTVVIATDTRSMSEAEAVAETRRIASAISHQPSGTNRQPSVLFKKTDSALRGHVVAELRALMETTGYQRAVYLPANPSKGRIIRNGVYYIKEVRGERSEVRDVPLDETDFSFDPEFPAKTSILRERFPDAEAKGIIMPDAEREEDIRRVIAEYNDGKTLFAGAADLFSAMLDANHTNHRNDSPDLHRFAAYQQNRPHDSQKHPRDFHDSLILCGSTQSKALELGIPVSAMPREVYDGEQGADYWLSQLPSSIFHRPSSIILAIPHTHRTGKEVAVYLRTIMAEMAKRLVGRHRPEQLMIEGGATAWATLQALGWTQFTIERQIAPGVVQMRATSGTLVTLKPGSYPWGSMFKSWQFL